MQKDNVSIVRQESRNHGEGPPARTTVFLNEGINFALELYAYKTRIPKGEVIRTALRNYLKAHGMDPSRIPSIVDRLADPTPERPFRRSRHRKAKAASDK